MSSIVMWENYLLKLPENDFFNLVSIYLGKIKTPYNKHELIGKLNNYLASATFQEKALSLLTIEDAKLLTSIHNFSKLSLDQLYELFKNDYSKTVFYNKLLNLEERLLIFNDINQNKLVLNPFFLDKLLEDFISLDNLFKPQFTVTQKDSDIPWFSDALFYSIISFFMENDFAFKVSGEIRKKTHEKLVECFQLDEEILLIVDFLLRNDIFVINENGRTEINIENYLTYNILPALDILLLVATADDGAVSQITKLTKTILSTLPKTKAYSKASLVSIFSFVQKILVGGTTSTAYYEKLIDKLVLTNLLVEKDDAFFINSHIDFESGTEYLTQSVIHENLEVIVHPWGNPRFGFYIPLFCELESFNMFPTFHMTKKSIFRFFDHKYKPDMIFEIISNYCHTDAPLIIKQHIDNFYNEYNSLKLINGIAIISTPSKISTIKNSGAIDQYILAAPAENVLILDSYHVKEWKEKLYKAGIEHIPTIEHQKTNTSSHNDVIKPEIIKQLDLDLTFNESENKIVSNEVSMHDIAPELFKKAEKITSDPQSLENIKAKIEKKLILFEDQITPSVGNQIHIEASGMDYQKKVSVIKQAIREQHYILELTIFVDFQKQVFLLVPRKIDKLETKHILFGKLLETDSEYEVNISKIGKVRLLRSSLFSY